MTGSAEHETPDEAWSTRGLPRRLGRYELLAEIGAGGMASVYLARTTGPGRFHKWVAVKRVHPHLARDKKFVEMFLDEARLAAAVQHPNVAQVFDLGEEDGEFFLAMEYLEGEHLGAIASTVFHKRHMRFPLPLATRIGAAAAHGLHQAHEACDENGDSFGLVHRDVSPHNIFVTYGGDVKVMDFGVAKAAGRITSTETGGRKGKLAYMSPEQLLNEGVDRRTDVFALGVVLWEITVGRRLFRGDTDAQTISRILSGKVAPPSTLVSDYPIELEQVVLKALARDPSERFATAQEMGSELEQFEKRYSTATGARGIAGLMKDLFEARIEEKKQQLRSVKSGTTPLSASTPGVVLAPGELGGSTEVTPPPQRDPEVSHVATTSRIISSPEPSRSRTLLWVMLGVALIGAVAGAAWTMGRASSTPSTPPQASAPEPPIASSVAEPPPSTVIAVEAPPSSAVIAPPPESVAEASSPRSGTHAHHGHGTTAPPTQVAPPVVETPVAHVATRIQVLALGAWAHVRIDGREVGQTPYNGEVPVGAHTIELTTEDGRTFTEQRSADEGALLRVTHRFE